MGKVHSFEESLNKAENQANDLLWKQVYKKAFPNMVNCMPLRKDCEMQRMGVDRVITLDNSRTLYIDEKIRFKNYPDILLEFISVDTTGAVGWMEKPLAIDYLAYMFFEAKKVYMIDWRMLKRVWKYYGERWKKKYTSVVADNGTYKTHSIAVPIDDLLKAVSNAGMIKLKIDDDI